MIEITANTRQATVTNKELLTTGSAGIVVQFTLSDDFAGLACMAVFRQGEDGKKVDVALDNTTACVVPAEVLTEEGEVLFIGIYGANGQGTIIIPTVWAAAGVVKPGTDPNTPAEAEPTPEIWAQILSIASDAGQEAGDALTMATRAANAAEEAVNSCAEDRAAADFAMTQAQAASNSAVAASESTRTNSLKAEGYAVGTQDGDEVESGTYYQNNASYYASLAQHYSGTAATSAQSANSYKNQASTYATNASNSAVNASSSKTAAEGYAKGTSGGTPVSGSSQYYHNNAEWYSKQSKSWAVGGTSTRTGEDTDNAKYYSEQAETAVGSIGDSVEEAHEYATASRRWAVGGTHTVEDEDTDNAKYYSEQAANYAQAADDWLDENVAQETGYVLDRSLTLSNAAAPADLVGDLKSEINSFTQKKSPNIFDGDFDESGYIDDGVDKSSSSFKRTSKYYPIDAVNDGSLYAVLTETVDVFSILFFDSTKTWISNATVNNTLTKTITLPATARFFRAYTRTTFAGNVTLSLTPVSSYIPYAEGLKLADDLVDYESLASDLSGLFQFNPGVNIFDGNYDESGWIDDGVDKSSSSYVRTSNYYPIDASKGNLFVYHENSGTVSLLFYDSTKTWIRNANIGGAGTTTVSIPSNAAYYRSYKNVSVTDGITFAYTSVSSYIPYAVHLAIKDDSITYDMLTDDVKSRLGVPLIGKTIAFMGDSVIGNFYDSTGIPAIVAEKTGATVINCGFGGTRMAYNHGESIQYTYMNAISGAGLAGAIASGTWTDQDAAIAGLTGVPDYFSERLTTLKGIDWSEVDFIMWEYGTNDFANGVELEDTNDPTNLFAYENAYRYAIETILTEYPNIRIIPITPTYRWYQSGGVFTEDSNTHTETDYGGSTHKLTDFVAMAEEVSKDYQLPCIDDYYTLGANQYTRLAYFDSTDGTHPNASGRQRMAEHISAQLMSLV